MTFLTFDSVLLLGVSAIEPDGNDCNFNSGITCVIGGIFLLDYSVIFLKLTQLLFYLCSFNYMFIEFFLKTPVFMTIGTIDLIYSGFNSAVICLTGAKDARIGLFLLGLYSLLLSLERIGDSVNML